MNTGRAPRLPGRPFVSVITPVYNRASYIEQTIRSVLSQDYDNLEYIVLDDGSTDESPRIIETLAASHPAIRYDSHPNMGETRTVNKAFGMVRGEIVGVVSSDDPLLPGAIAAAVELLTRRKDLLVVYPDWYLIDEVDRVLQYRRTFDFSYINMLRWHHCMPGPGTFFRRCLVDLLGGRDEEFRYVADFDFWLRAGLIGPFARIPRILATFRWHSGGASSKEQGTQMAAEHIRLTEKLYATPNLPEEVLKVRREAMSRAYYEAGVVLGDKALETKRKYFLRAFALCPTAYLFDYNRLKEPLVLLLLGTRIYVHLRRMYSNMNRICAKKGKKVDVLWGTSDPPQRTFIS